MAAELYLLDSGAYSVTLTADGDIVHRQQIQVTGARTTVPLTLPPRKLCRLQVSTM
jgi:hypothetical protein